MYDDIIWNWIYSFSATYLLPRNKYTFRRYNSRNNQTLGSISKICLNLFMVLARLVSAGLKTVKSVTKG